METTTEVRKVSLRMGIGDAVSFDLGPKDLENLRNLTVESGIDFLLARPAVDKRFANSMRQFLSSDDIVLEIMQGSITQVLLRKQSLQEVIVSGSPIEIGVSKTARGGFQAL